MSLFNPSKLSPKQIERRDRTRVKGRKHFIFFRGILGVGGLMFISNLMFWWYDDFGWQVPHGIEMYVRILVGLVIWPTAGYFWATWFWRKYYGDSIR